VVKLDRRSVDSCGRDERVNNKKLNSRWSAGHSESRMIEKTKLRHNLDF